MKKERPRKASLPQGYTVNIVTLNMHMSSHPMILLLNMWEYPKTAHRGTCMKMFMEVLFVLVEV